MVRKDFVWIVVLFVLGLSAIGFAQESAICLHSGNLVGIQKAPRVDARLGNVVVVWQSNDSVYWQVYFAVSRDNGQSFSQPQPIPNDSTPTDKLNPDVALAPNGDAYLVWQDKRSGGDDYFAGDFDIYFAMLLNDAVEPSAERLLNRDETKGSQIKPRVVSLKNGAPVVVWQDNRLSEATDSSTRWEVRMTYSEDLGASFVEPITVSVQTDAFNTDASIGASRETNAFAVVWFDWSSGGVWREFSGLGVEGSDVRRFDESTSAYMVKPEAARVEGGWWLVWQDSRDSAASVDPNWVRSDPVYWDIYAMFVPEDGSAQPPLRVNSAVIFSQLEPTVCSDGTTAFVCYADGSTLSEYRVKCGKLTQQGLADEFEVAPELSGDQRAPDCAYDQGVLYVVWEQESPTGDLDVYFSRIEIE